MAEENRKPMTGAEVLKTILALSRSQGFYGRLYAAYDDMRREDPEAYAQALAELEAEKFDDILQIALYFEEGVHHARVFWRVPVVYESYGVVEVEAASAAEAYRKVKDDPDAYGLPDDREEDYGSLRVADDDEESAVATIEKLSGNGEESL